MRRALILAAVLAVPAAAAGLVAQDSLDALRQRVTDLVTTAENDQALAAEGKATALREAQEAQAAAAQSRELDEAAAQSALIAKQATTRYVQYLESRQAVPVPMPDIIVDPEPGIDPTGSSRPTAWFDAHEAVKRTATENKAAYLGVKRASRRMGPVRQRIQDSRTDNAAAPDIADIDYYAVYLWGLNIALNEEHPETKAGNVDLARLSIQPAPAGTTEFDAAHEMNWGMRRYNLGDTTVTDCDFTDIPKEHGIYDNLGGHALYRGNTFLRLGSQAMQLTYRDQPYQQYLPDNSPFTGSATWMIEDCHAVDCGNGGRRPSFAYTMFDPGSVAHPGMAVIRDTTYVCQWPVARERSTYKTVPIGTHRSIRAIRGFVIHQYQQHTTSGAFATSHALLQNTVWDITSGEGPMGAIRGVGEIYFKDSAFIARDHDEPYVDIDDAAGANASGTVVLQNCVSPEPYRTYLRIRAKPVIGPDGLPVHFDCPGQRIEIDVATREVRYVQPKKDRIEGLVSPLDSRAGKVPSGITPQAPGHINDLGTVELVYR